MYSENRHNPPKRPLLSPFSPCDSIINIFSLVLLKVPIPINTSADDARFSRRKTGHQAACHRCVPPTQQRPLEGGELDILHSLHCRLLLLRGAQCHLGLRARCPLVGASRQRARRALLRRQVGRPLILLVAILLSAQAANCVAIKRE